MWKYLLRMHRPLLAASHNMLAQSSYKDTFGLKFQRCTVQHGREATSAEKEGMVIEAEP